MPPKKSRSGKKGKGGSAGDEDDQEGQGERKGLSDTYRQRVAEVLMRPGNTRDQLLELIFAMTLPDLDDAIVQVIDNAPPPPPPVLTTASIPSPLRRPSPVSPRMGWGSPPGFMLHGVFGFTSTRVVISALRLVCKGWNQSATIAQSFDTHIDLMGLRVALDNCWCKLTIPLSLLAVARRQAVASVALPWYEPQCMQLIRHLPTLTSISLHATLRPAVMSSESLSQICNGNPRLSALSLIDLDFPAVMPDVSASRIWQLTLDGAVSPLSVPLFSNLRSAAHPLLCSPPMQAPDRLQPRPSRCRRFAAAAVVGGLVCQQQPAMPQRHASHLPHLHQPKLGIIGDLDKLPT
jgi:hypothetical protein